MILLLALQLGAEDGTGSGLEPALVTNSLSDIG